MGPVSLPRSLLGYLLGLVLVLACAREEKGEENTACTEQVERLRACNLLGQGRTPCPGQATETQLCTARCLNSASCDQVQQTVCGEIPAAILSCWMTCGVLVPNFGVQPGGVERPCPDNLSTAVDCNGFMECSDGSDEDGCMPAFCESGKMLFEAQICNGLIDCFNGSDEVCRYLFHCDNGEAREPEDECDGVAECTDGSDEARCYVCTNGTRLPADLECNGEVDCPDGADELGCAQVACD